MNLTQEMEALRTEGATSQQMVAWQQKNAARFTAQQQRAQQIGNVASLQPVPLLTEVAVPDGISKELGDYLITQAELYNASAQMHNQQIQSGSQDPAVAVAKARSVGQSNVALSQQQSATEAQTSTKQFQVVAAQLSNCTAPALPPAIIPANASPQLQAYLLQRDQLMREQIQVWNQNATSTPEARFAAMQQWATQNFTRLTQLKQMAQNLSQPQN